MAGRADKPRAAEAGGRAFAAAPHRHMEPARAQRAHRGPLRVAVGASGALQARGGPGQRGECARGAWRACVRPDQRLDRPRRARQAGRLLRRAPPRSAGKGACSALAQPYTGGPRRERDGVGGALRARPPPDGVLEPAHGTGHPPPPTPEGVNPSAHTHSDAVAAPVLTVVVPLGHATHALAPLTDAKVPRPHAAHAPSAATPLYVPGAHALQLASASACPRSTTTTGAALPLSRHPGPHAQSRTDAAPAAVPWKGAGHAAHAVAAEAS